MNDIKQMYDDLEFQIDGLVYAVNANLTQITDKKQEIEIWHLTTWWCNGGDRSHSTVLVLLKDLIKAVRKLPRCFMCGFLLVDISDNKIKCLEVCPKCGL